MKKFITNAWLLFVAMATSVATSSMLTSCSNSIDEPLQKENSSQHTAISLLRTEEEAIDIAIKSLALLDRDVPKSRASLSMIADVTVVRSETKSRSGAQGDTLLYAVNFTDNQGFALIPASKQVPELLAITENGNYSAASSQDNPGFNMYMDISKQFLTNLKTIDPDSVSTPLNPDKNNDLGLDFKPFETDPNRQFQEMKETEDTTWFYRVMPRVKVRWDQHPPYGDLAKNKIAGCAPVAMAQCMSFFNHPKHMNFTFENRELNELYIDWDELKLHIEGYYKNCTCPYYKREINHKHLAHIIRQIGEDAGSKYDMTTNQTGTRTPSTMNLLRKHGFKVGELIDYKCENGTNIKNGLILIRGKGKNKNGQDGAHIWVLDGVKNFVVTHTCFYRKNGSANWEVMSQSKHKYHFNHFNWGWGGYCDGWFNDMVFNSDNPIDYSYFNQGYVDEGWNFTQNIKYFTVDL